MLLTIDHKGRTMTIYVIETPKQNFLVRCTLDTKVFTYSTPEDVLMCIKVLKHHFIASMQTMDEDMQEIISDPSVKHPILYNELIGLGFKDV